MGIGGTALNAGGGIPDGAGDLFKESGESTVLEEIVKDVLAARQAAGFRGE
jgi:hypothetical protein